MTFCILLNTATFSIPNYGFPTVFPLPRPVSDTRNPGRVICKCNLITGRKCNAHVSPHRTRVLDLTTATPSHCTQGNHVPLYTEHVLNITVDGYTTHVRKILKSPVHHVACASVTQYRGLNLKRKQTYLHNIAVYLKAKVGRSGAILSIIYAFK